MEKVIIYGVYGIELRRKVESFLNSKYEIVGYSDTYLECDVLDNKPFFHIEELIGIEFDYLVVAIRNTEICCEVIEDLVSRGINRRKMVIPSMLTDDYCVFQKDLLKCAYEGVNEDVEVLIFGLSYSLREIHKQKLNKKAFDFSWHGLDLYYNCQLFEKVKAKTKAKTALMVFPYDYFNYDMSSSQYQYTRWHMMSVSGLDDYHNGEYLEDVLNSITCMRLFAEKFMAYYHARENIYRHKAITDSERLTLGHLWCKDHEKTFEENKEIFKAFINELKKVVNRIVVIVPPFLLSRINNPEVIEPRKKQFYEVLKPFDIEVVDLMDALQEDRYYEDVTHLNYEGALVFTEMINEIIG
ncbi:MAG: hypothetical protein IJ683_07060 [Butyrivibrio sp.]|nr:hypothetical protein [Butyrivibrio sp.]MBR1642062.1 hypothetical protein [Butyrivibrio sp.]